MWKPNNWLVRQGEENKILLHLFDSAGSPMNISGASSIALRFKNADDSVLEKQAEQGLTWGTFNPVYIYGFTLSAAESALLPMKADQSVDVVIGYAEKHFHTLMPKALTVAAPVTL